MTSAARYSEYMPNLYDTPKDLYDRLEQTIVRYDGIPYVCRTKNGDGVGDIQLFDLVTTKGKLTKESVITCKPNDPALDISMMECMYINFVPELHGLEGSARALYMTRNTSKHYKAGTYPEYTMMKDVDGVYRGDLMPRTVLFTQEGKNALMGIYPNLSEVLRIMKTSRANHKFDVAVSQEVALSREKIGLVKIYFRMELVGWIDPDTEFLKITNDDRRWVLKRIMEPLGFKM